MFAVMLADDMPRSTSRLFLTTVGYVLANVGKMDVLRGNDLDSTASWSWVLLLLRIGPLLDGN
jgi:hypothetical protein